jgi:hypothetical protein
MPKCKLIMVIVFELEDTFSQVALTWTERREFIFESESSARVQFIQNRNKFRRDNPDFKTAFAIYEMLEE